MVKLIQAEIHHATLSLFSQLFGWKTPWKTAKFYLRNGSLKKVDRHPQFHAFSFGLCKKCVSLNCEKEKQGKNKTGYDQFQECVK